MLIYLVYFSVSVYFAYLASRTTDRKRFFLYSAVSIFVVAFLAGMRGYHIGVDTVHYYELHRYWRNAYAKDSLWDYLAYYSTTGYGEYLFAVFIGIIAQTIGKFPAFLFLSHLVIVSGVYIGAFRQRRHVEPALVLLLFYLIFFNHSLNISRQYMAMAIIFAVFADIEEGKYGRYLITVLIATQIHGTALVAVFPLILYMALYSNISLPYKGRRVVTSMKLRRILIPAALMVLVWFFVPIGRMLLAVGILPDKYTIYLYPGELTPGYIVMALITLELAAVWVMRNMIRRRTLLHDYFIMIAVCHLIMQQLTGMVDYGKRIAGYSSLNNLLTISLLDSSCTTRRQRLVVRAGIISVSMFYWLYMYVLRNASETFPYAFAR